jgi:hypothetical protein
LGDWRSKIAVVGWWLRPAPDDPIGAARGALAGDLSMTIGQLRAEAREAATAAEHRRAAE